MGNYMGAAKKDKKPKKDYAPAKVKKVTSKNKSKKRTPKKISY
tara:strand:- start:37 stop:165 length:129 start_codon:yes stop_codon:yes gene_type:complete